jgi:hypothetical protein
VNIIRIVFGLIGGAWLLGMLAFGLGTTWLTHDPDAAAGVALGAMAVDADAGVMDNARGFAGGYSAGRSLSENMRDSAARSELRRSCEEQEDSDWGAPEHCHDLEQADRETYERISNDW